METKNKSKASLNNLDVQAQKQTYKRRPNGSKVIEFPMQGSSMTDQSFQESCNINTIMDRFAKTGQLPNNMREPGQYLDLSSVGEYQDSLNIIATAREAFEALPSDIRKRFNNEPAELLSFMENPDNLDEGVKLGLFTKEQAEKQEPVQVIVTNPEPAPAQK